MSHYICPHCKKPLTEDATGFVCENNHRFDRSAEGYVNLAPPRACGDLSGDAADTCRARRRFLESGQYAPLANALCEILREKGNFSHTSLILDAGCGEGYYDRRIREALPDLCIYGVDLAKTGIRMAAKLEKNLPHKNHYAVAGIFDLPFADESAAVLLSVFAPVPEKEAFRVLAPGGLLVVASPGKRHLYGLKQALYDAPLENEEKAPDYEGFTLEDTRIITYTMQLSGETAGDLFAMTPYFWRSSGEIREKSAHLEAVETEADFRVKVYRKM